ncbi:MAG: S8 family serine peptidase [Calditrichaceae bacterium]
MKKYFVILLLYLFLFQQTHAQSIPDRYRAKTPDEKKISTLILNLIPVINDRVYKNNELTAAQFSAGYSNYLLQIDQNLRIRVTISVSGDFKESLAFVKSSGGEITAFNEKFGLIDAWIPFKTIIPLASGKFITNIRETEMGHTRSGSVTSEGDTLHHTDIVRNILGGDGTGITVGVISDGCDSITDPQSTGDLPASINVIDNSEVGDEGTAMLEIIHDLAPGAGLAFSEGIESSTEFINSINDLVAAGCQVVVDDIGFFGEPWFEEGPIASAARDAIVNDGIVYASSAGNSREDHYEGDFSGLGSQLSLNDVHDFSGSGDWTQQIRVGGSTMVIIYLQWSEPFDGVTSQYDVHLANQSATSLLSVSRSRPDVNDPYVYIWYYNFLTTVDTLNVIIEKNSGTDRRVELAYNYFGSSSIAVDEYYDLPGSINGQPAVSEVIAAGAVRYDSPNTLEYFSSIGPSRIYSYPSYTYEDRNKPDIVAVDGNIITGAGGFGQEYPGGSGQIRFFGTSASAPHAAACAAAIWSAYPNLTNTQVKDRILNSAVDLGSAGFDYLYGYGRIDAQQAADSPQFTVSGINGANNSLISTTLVPGDALAELTGYTFAADQSPHKVYLNSISFSVGGTVNASDINDFSLYEDTDGDKVITPGVDNLLDSRSFNQNPVFSNLGYSFSDAGSDLIITADIKSTANPEHTMSIALTNNTDVNAYFGVFPFSTNFPFNSPDISLPVELLYFSALPKDGYIHITWETASEIDAAFFEIEKNDTVIARISAAGNSSSGQLYSFHDKNPLYDRESRYTLYLTETNGQRERLQSSTATLALPENPLILQNYPNPFNPETRILYSLSRDARVELTIFDIRGALVRQLVDEYQTADQYELIFSGERLASGIYLLRLVTLDNDSVRSSRTRRMLLLR